MANQSVLELAVGTGKWDAGLKKAKQSLDNFTQANGGLQQALEKESQKMGQFVQMMGKMDSTAKTAKGQMNDYKSTIEQLTMQYNRMTDAQKQTIGQDYLKAIDQMKQKYQAVNEEIQEINKSLNQVKMPEGGGDLLKGGGLFSGDKLSGMLQVFGGNVMTKLAGMGVGLAAEMKDMVMQGIELAKQGEGIRIAFERLGRGDILDGLRKATHGTVTDLELMKAAVKFNDFKLPVEELGTMLAFAQQKAKDTGQSVDYMVDSIVTGLGRKSLMILDNLGLSATEIKERMKETGDITKAVGAIIREQMAAAGDYVETAADRATQATVSLQNKMEELGRKFAPVEEASTQLWTSMKIGILDIVGGPLAELLNGLTEAGRLKNMLNDMNGEAGSGNTKVDQQLKKLNVIKKGGGSDYIFNSTLSGMVEDYNRQIMALDAQIKNGGKPIGGGSGSSQDVRYLQQKMDALKIMRDQLEAGAKELNKPIKIDVNTNTVDLTTNTPKGGNTKLNPIQQASVDVQKAEKDYADAISNAQQMLVENMMKSDDYDKQVLDGHKKLSDAYLKAYNATGDDKYLNSFRETAQHINEMQGVVDKNIEAQKQAEQAAREQAAAQKKLADAQAKQAELVKSWENPNSQGIGNYITQQKNALSTSIFGSAEYGNIAANLADANAYKNIIQKAIQEGLNDMVIDSSPLWKQITDGANIDDSVWQGMVDKINEKLAEKKQDLFNIDYSTGEESKKSDNNKLSDDLSELSGKIGGFAGGLSSISSGLKGLGIELPKEVDTVIGAISGMSQIISGVGTIISIFGSTEMAANTIALGTNTTTMLGLITALELNSAMSVIPFARGGIVHAAQGYVPGNNYSGDMVPALLNSGELVLNKAQQNTLANELQGGGMQNLHLRTEVSGRNLVVVIENDLKARGKGQLATFK